MNKEFIKNNYMFHSLNNNGVEKFFCTCGEHFEVNKSKTLCLNTRLSNINSISLYKKVGYNHIANIKNYYDYPPEDSVFMIKEII
jgi:ribosomal protein S18 acetylase RimI-like enzyme